MTNPTLTWIDGQAATALDLFDGAVQYGDGVFRTMLVWDGAVRQMDEQLDKLISDALKLGLQPPTRAVLHDDLGVISADRGTVKLALTAGNSGRGYARTRASCRRLMYFSTLPDRPAQFWQSGISVASLNYRSSEQPALAGIKHLNRLDQVMARALQPAEAQEGLMADQAGNLLSGVMSNVFWHRAGQWHTHPLSNSGVAGHMRERIIAAFQHLDIPLNMSFQAMSEVQKHCTGAFVCNSVVGLWPVRYWDGRALSDTADLGRLIAHLAHPYRGVSHA